jgi:AbrB family looped-hinge helix DNA binding protein
VELVKVTSKGQITIPRDIRQKLSLETGDKILFFEENGRYFFQNSRSSTLKTFQEAMKGEAKKTGFKDPDDVVNYIKAMRKRTPK